MLWKGRCKTVTSKLLSNLSLCRKAGFLKMGFDPVWESIGRGANLILFASDISPKTKERMEFHAQKMNVRTLTIPHATAEIFAVVGKNIAVMSLTNKPFAEKILAMAGAPQTNQ